MKRLAEIILMVLAAATTAAAGTFPLRSSSYGGQVTGRVARAGSDYAHCFTGAVTRVIDGDTIVVGTNIVRLAEIDAPELKTPHGPASKAALSEMILSKAVTVTWSRRGRYRRIIGQVHLDGEWINLSMVVQGRARQFHRYSRSRELESSESEARHSKRGIWSSLTPSSCRRMPDLASSKRGTE